VTVASGPPDQPLQQLRFESRIGDEARQFDDITVAIRKSEIYATLSDDAQIEVVELVADVLADDDAQSAVLKVGPVLERVVELMSFELGAHAKMREIDALDTTPPVELGEERSWSAFTTTPVDIHMTREEAAALRWFVKALATDALHDQFIFLWIALEIMCDASGVKVTEPYKCRHGHVIARCPTCDATTEQLVRGQTLRAYLEAHGASQQQAKDLWALRQLMHGVIPFDSARLESLGALVQALRSIVGGELKARFGLGVDRLPIYAAEGLSIHPAMGMSGTTKATEEWIAPLI
jgi:hypothetical protein